MGFLRIGLHPVLMCLALFLLLVPSWSNADSECGAECAKPSSENDLLVRHAVRDRSEEKNNDDTKGQWVPYMDHRAQVTAILEKAAQMPNGRLCVVGAGNSNDLDLKRLLRTYSRIDLLDIDGNALSRGVAKQLKNDELKSRVFLHAGVDMLGVPPGTPAGDVLEQMRLNQTAALFGSVVGHGCDVVVGTCIVSQMVNMVNRRLHDGGCKERTGCVLDKQGEQLMMRQYAHTLSTMARPSATSRVVHISDMTTRDDGFDRKDYFYDEIHRDHLLKDNIFPGTDPRYFETISLELNGALSKPSYVTRASGKSPLFWPWCIDRFAEGKIWSKCMVVYAMEWFAARTV